MRQRTRCFCHSNMCHRCSCAVARSLGERRRRDNRPDRGWRDLRRNRPDANGGCGGRARASTSCASRNSGVARRARQRKILSTGDAHFKCWRRANVAIPVRTLAPARQHNTFVIRRIVAHDFQYGAIDSSTAAASMGELKESMTHEPSQTNVKEQSWSSEHEARRCTGSHTLGEQPRHSGFIPRAGSPQPPDREHPYIIHNRLSSQQQCKPSKARGPILISRMARFR